MNDLLILENGRIIDPLSGVDAVGSLWIEGGCIIPAQSTVPPGAQRLDVAGCWIVPGLIDMHVHLRDPGQEYKETIESGTNAAAAGGITAVACMPNTTPVNDCAEVTRYILERAVGCKARVYPVGAVSRKSHGKEIADYAEMKDAGVIAVTDDGLPVVDSQLMRRAMEYAKSHDLFVMSHSEEIALSCGGCMNEGDLSTKLGLKGIPNSAESIMVYRDIALAELTGCHIHFSHISTKESLDLIRQAKARGAKVSAETTPHYFTLTDDAVDGYNTAAKMNPPLRSHADRQAVLAALADGTLDAIATDHAPHTEIEKDVEFDLAANGIIGLETSLALALQLVHNDYITPQRLVELMSVRPAQILGVKGGRIAVGDIADVTVIDPESEFTYDADTVVSKGKNSPFLGWSFKGRAKITLVEGEITHQI